MDSTLSKFYEQEMRIGYQDNVENKREHHQMMEGIGYLNTHEFAMQALELQRQLGGLLKQSNLTRAIYVQEFLENRIEALIKAKEKVQQIRETGGIVPGINGERTSIDDGEEGGERSSVMTKASKESKASI